VEFLGLVGVQAAVGGKHRPEVAEAGLDWRSTSMKAATHGRENSVMAGSKKLA
jgi:hypothetical protein